MADRTRGPDQGCCHAAVIDVAGTEPKDPWSAGFVGQGVDFGGAPAA
jgi:hypothetical protein